MEERSVLAKNRPDLVNVIAIYRFLVALLVLIGLCVLLFALFMVAVTAIDSEALFPILVLLVISGFLAVIVIANVAVGWGLLQLKEWARWGAIILGIFDLANFPLGTALGGLSIWYLLTAEGQAAFHK